MLLWSVTSSRELTPLKISFHMRNKLENLSSVTLQCRHCPKLKKALKPFWFSNKLSVASDLAASLADWVTILSWPVTRSRPPASDLVIKRVTRSRSRAQDFQVPLEAHLAWHRKWPAKAAQKLRGHRKTFKAFVFQILFRLVCTEQSARHEGSCQWFLHPCNSYWLKFNLCWISEFFAAENNLKFLSMLSMHYLM